MPLSPSIPVGLSLDRDGTHFSCVRDGCRAIIEQYVKAGKDVRCFVMDLGRRWVKLDSRLGIYRMWQEGTAICWIERTKDSRE
jgi:hypothetical protein